MTTKCVAGQQDDINCKHNRADANAECSFPAVWIDKPKRFPDVVGQNQKEKERKIKKVTMNILHDERERPFAPVAFTRFTDGARRRISPERFIVRAAIVVTGQPKPARRPKNQ